MKRPHPGFPGRPHPLTAPALAALIAAHAGLLAWGASVHSPVWDEVGHMAAGVSHWRSGRFDLYRVNPPLVRLVATLPAVLAGADIDWGRYDASPWRRPEFDLGAGLIRSHGGRTVALFTAARWACIPFSVLGAVACFLWARELYGDLSGLAAALLWCASPNVLANASLITPDAGAAALGVTAGYAYWRWLRRPSASRAAAAGVLLGLALLTKFTLLVLPPVWAALWLTRRLWLGRPPRGDGWGRGAALLALTQVVAFQVVALGYGYEGAGTPLGEFRFVSRALAGPAAGSTAPPRNRFAGTWAGRVPVPLPANFVSGVDVQRSDFERRMWSYLRGEWRFGGWWYYYLYGLAVKEPVGNLALLALAAAAAARSPRRRGRPAVAVLAPAAAVLALVSSQTGFNHHLRYVLPALPYLYIWAGSAFRPGVGGAAARGLRAAGAACLAWSCAASLACSPHHLSYFNEVAGGPINGPRHLLNSNVDWGQDFLHLRRWVRDHPEARPIQVLTANCYSPKALGGWDGRTYHPRVPDSAVGAAPEDSFVTPRWYAISVGRLYDRVPEGEPDVFAWFRDREPVARVGYTINVYKVE